MSNPQNPGSWESQPPQQQQPYGAPPPGYGQAPYGAPPPAQYQQQPYQQQPYMPQSSYQPMYPISAPVQSAAPTTAVMVMGIIGGIFGVLVSLLIILGGAFVSSVEVGASTGTGWGALVIVWGLLGVAAAVGGMICSIITKKNPLICGIVLCIAGVAGFFLTSWLWFITGVLFVISGILVLVNQQNYANS